MNHTSYSFSNEGEYFNQENNLDQTWPGPNYFPPDTNPLNNSWTMPLNVSAQPFQSNSDKANI